MKRFSVKIIIALICLFRFFPVFPQEKIVFSADKMRGSSSASGTTVLEGNASVKAGSMEISGDLIEMNGKNSRFIVATGNVSGTDENEGYFFTANKLKYDRELEYAVLEGSAVMEDVKNNVTAKGGIITYDKKNETAVMQINVRILKEEIACRASFAVYSRARDLLELTGAPTVVKGNDSFNASKITVDLKTEDIVLEGYVSGSVTEEQTQEESKPSVEESGTKLLPAESGTSIPGNSQPQITENENRNLLRVPEDGGGRDVNPGLDSTETDGMNGGGDVSPDDKSRQTMPSIQEGGE